MQEQGQEFEEFLKVKKNSDRKGLQHGDKQIPINEKVLLFRSRR